MDQTGVDDLIDSFVARINGAARDRIREEDLPVHLREGGARYGLYYSWKIQRFNHVTWIDPLEMKMGLRFPPSYRSLVTRYVFPAFPVPPLLLLGNTGHALYSEMAYTLLRDQALSGELRRHGFIQIGRPSEGDYDPICFDTSHAGEAGEYPLVRLNHAAVLQGAAVAGMHRIASSFQQFIEHAVLRGADYETLPAPIPEIPAAD